MTDLTRSPDLTLKVVPAVWGSLLVVSTYVLVQEGTGDRFLAGLSALLTGVSTQVLVGIDAGIVANWLALSIAYLFFAVLLRGMRTQRLAYVLPCYSLFVALLFVHPWTWALSVVVLVLYLAFTLIESGIGHTLRRKRFESMLLVTLLGLGLATDALKSLLPTGSGLSVGLSTILPAIKLSNVILVVPHLQQSFQLFLGGAMGDPLWYVLATLGVVTIPGIRGRFARLMLIWVAAVGLGVVVIGGDATLQSRLINDVPLQIFAAIGLVTIADFMYTTFGKRSGRWMSGLLIASVVGLFLGFALEYAGYLYV